MSENLCEIHFELRKMKNLAFDLTFDLIFCSFTVNYFIDFSVIIITIIILIIIIIIMIIIVIIIILIIIMSKLTESQLNILSNYYVRTYDMWEAWGDTYDTLEIHGNEKRCYMFRMLCYHKGRIIENKNNKFICIIKSKINSSIFNELYRNCFIKVTNKKNSEWLTFKFDDEIVKSSLH